MAYIKPQSPLKLGEDHIYPLTTYDQIIMDDGSRWDGISTEGNSLRLDLTNAEQGTLPSGNVVYYKPNNFIQRKEDFISPLTTYDQVILPDGSRWNGNTAIPQIFSQAASLPLASWVADESGETYSQTVAVEGITIDINKTNAIVSPSTDRAMEEEYLGCEVRASSQGDGTLIFTCTSLPTIDLEANVMVLTKGV